MTPPIFLRSSRIASVCLLMFVASVMFGQKEVIGLNSPDAFLEKAILHPPANSPVAIIEFEDLECPACAYAFPIVQKAVERFHIPLVRYDYPLPLHQWAYPAAVYARWLRKTRGVEAENQYRKQIYLNQSKISTQEDLAAATSKFQVPLNVVKDKVYLKLVDADIDAAKRLNVVMTPTVIVVTNDRYDIVSGNPKVDKARFNELERIIETALAAQLVPVHQPK